MAPLAAVVSFAVPPGRYARRALRTEIVHPLLTAAAVGLLVGCVTVFGPTLHAAVAAVFCASLVVVTATDLEYRVVPNRVVLPVSALVLAGMTAAEPSAEWALSALGASGFLLVASLVNPSGMGMGDVKLAFLMGAVLGRSVAVAFAVGLAASLVLTIILFARHGRAARKMTFPFAPFLALGSVVALFAGEL